jgi:purine-binding chemotaxis protein CheW
MANIRTTIKSAIAQTSSQFSTFIVANLFFGVDVLDVQEVLCAQQMTTVPQAPDVIQGFINLRGQIITAIDMRRRLQLPARSEGQPSMNVVIRTSDGAVSLLVDEIGDVLEMDAASYERPPQNLDAAAREIIRGVYKLKDSLLLVLDTEKTIEVDSSLNLRNGRFDAQGRQGPPVARRSSSPDPEGFEAEKTQATRAQSSTKAGNRRTAAIEISGASREVQTAPA